MKSFLARLLTAAALLFPALTQAVCSDAAGRMATATGGQAASYTYYADQLRASKTVNGVVTRYHYGPDGRLLAETDGSTGAVLREYIWDDEVPVAQTSAGPIVYLHTDHLGTPRLGTNSVGAEVWRWDSDAFGTTAPTGSTVVNLRFPGQYFDTETGLHYNWHRTYDPASGRYVESDPIGLAGGLNPFGYVGGNPSGVGDSTGLIADTAADLGFLGYDVYRILTDNVLGNKGNLKTNLAALGADSAGALIPGVTGLGATVRACNTANKVSREDRWVELAGTANSRLPKEVIDHITRHRGAGVYQRFGLELAHKPKQPSAQGFDYSEAIPMWAADHRGIQHRYLRESATGTRIVTPKRARNGGKLDLPPPGALP